MLDSTLLQSQIVLNGKTILLSNDYSTDHNTFPDHNLSIMGYPTKHSTGLTNDSFDMSFFGRMTDVNIWSRIFTKEEAIAWTQCEKTEGGDLLDWRLATWEALGLSKLELERDKICKSNSVRELQVFRVKMNFYDTIQLASVLGGDMASTDNSSIALEMIKTFSKEFKEKVCGPGPNFFGGFTDQDMEGQFVHYNTGKNLTWTMWYPGEPNNFIWNGQGEHCTALGKEKLFDIACSATYCPMLVLKKNPQFQLRGVCPDSVIDFYYTLLNYNETFLRKELLGFKQTKMVWSDIYNQWNIVNLVDGSTLAYTNSTKSFPFGSHQWFFTQTRCTEPGKSWKKLIMQQKSKRLGRFCCNDGVCMNSEYRCVFSINQVKVGGG